MKDVLADLLCCVVPPQPVSPVLYSDVFLSRCARVDRNFWTVLYLESLLPTVITTMVPTYRTRVAEGHSMTHSSSHMLNTDTQGFMKQKGAKWVLPWTVGVKPLFEYADYHDFVKHFDPLRALCIAAMQSCRHPLTCMLPAIIVPYAYQHMHTL